MPASDDWIEVALRVTGHFEGGDDPFGAVSGDFDGQGISVGVLQWNIGLGSLQPLVKNAGQDAVLENMPVFGDQFWSACNSTIGQGLATVRSWQSNSRLRSAPAAELKRCASSDAFIRQQLNSAKKVADRALSTAAKWNADLGRGDTSLREFCWFFDLLTQNGGLKRVTATDVSNFIAAAGPDRSDDLICNWLQARTSADAGFKDAHKNAALWRSSVPSDCLALFVTSYLRSQQSILEWRADVLNRKGTIALGFGWVHGEKHDLSPIMGSIGSPISTLEDEVTGTVIKIDELGEHQLWHYAGGRRRPFESTEEIEELRQKGFLDNRETPLRRKTFEAIPLMRGSAI